MERLPLPGGLTKLGGQVRYLLAVCALSTFVLILHVAINFKPGECCSASLCDPRRLGCRVKRR